MRRSFRFLALLACALPLACSDTSRTPTATAPPPVPRLSANPESNGSMIYRSEPGFAWWFWQDTEQQLVAVHSNYNAPMLWCEGTWDAYPVSMQDVVSGRYGAGEWLVHRFLKAPETYIFVFSGTLPWSNFDYCHPIASGVGRFVTTNNDVLAEQSDRPQANAWGVQAEGELTGAGGQRYHYNGHLRATWRPGDSSVIHQQVLLNLQPIGQ